MRSTARACAVVLAFAAPLSGGERDVEGFIEDARKTHWAFQPLAECAVPPATVASSRTARAEGEVDAFVLERLEREGLTPSAEADRRVLARRLFHDLLGLPPSPDEVEEFAGDAAPDALPRLVDRLLASPRYGERWGRHWLDVARYADTKGYVFTQEPRYPYSYTYRDYVIRAFNEDLPYDRFVLEQLAADRLDLGGDRRPLAALGFLTLGRRFSNRIHDIIDDRIDVVTRGLLGLTVTCSRCHDHKYDPVTMRDYYALYGVFASSVEPDDLPLLESPGDDSDYGEFERERAALQAKADEFFDEKYRELLTALRERAGDYLLAASRGAEDDDGRVGISLGADDLRPRVVRRVRELLESPEAREHPVLGLWCALAALPEGEFAAGAAAAAIETLKGSGAPMNAAVAAAFAEPPASLEEASRRYGELLRSVDRAWQEAVATRQSAGGSAAGGPLLDPAREEVRQVLHGDGSPFAPSPEQAVRSLSRDVRDRLRQLRRKVDELEVNHPQAPPRAMALVDAPRPTEPRVFERGDPNRPGDPVPRRFLAVLDADQQPFTDGSGRLELARELTRGSRALLARVLVNRAWLHHVGAGLVRTPGDFGYRGEPPTHPELLDFLARRFIEDGWSLKRLHRRILLSRTWRQRSDPQPEGSARDPANVLLWRAHGRRLDFESTRDGLLAVADRLDLRMGGRAVSLTSVPFSGRRTVYGFVDRQDLPAVFRNFDFASPDASCPERHETTVPQQALFFMNSPFAEEMAAALVRAPEVAAATDPRQRVQALYGRVFGRAAGDGECELGVRYVQEAPDPSKAWETYAHALLMSNEFMFVD